METIRDVDVWTSTEYEKDNNEIAHVHYEGLCFTILSVPDESLSDPHIPFDLIELPSRTGFFLCFAEGYLAHLEDESEFESEEERIIALGVLIGVNVANAINTIRILDGEEV